MKDMNDLRTEVGSIVQPHARSYDEGVVMTEAILFLMDEHGMLLDYDPEPATGSREEALAHEWARRAAV